MISKENLEKIGQYIFKEITDGEALDGDDIEQINNHLKDFI